MFITRRTNPFLFEVDESAGAGQAPAVETPDTAAEAAQQQAEVDWAKRYSDLQPEYTRATQEAAELRRQAELYQALLYAEDPDTRRQAAEALGIQIDEETADDTQSEPYLTREEWAQYQAQQRQADQARNEQQSRDQRLGEIEEFVDAQLASIADLDEEDADWIVQRAVAKAPLENGMPDVAGAHQDLVARDLARQKKWAKTKRTHVISPVGQAGTNAPDLTEMSTNQLTEWMVERARSMEEQ